MKRILSILTLGVASSITSVGISEDTPESAFTQDPWEQESGPVKVYILCGQSNMQGHAALRTLEYLVYNEETAGEYRQWKDRWGDWVERSDVWVWTTDGERYGKLKPGFGQSEKKMGPELGFGWVVGKHHDQQVLLIKTCWGGRSVKKDFLPPSAEMPSDEFFANELARRKERALKDLKKREPDATIDDVKITVDEIKEVYGKAYRDTISTTKNVLANLKEYFPRYDENQGYELAGFAFFQGWNDLVDGEQRQEKYANYTKRLAALIRDVRKDLEVPDLPVVIGELGASDRGDLQKAQEAVVNEPGMDRVQFVKTRDFWEPEVEQMVRDGVWNGPEWYKFYNVGSERGYHYLGSGKILYQIGKSMGKAMIELVEN